MIYLELFKMKPKILPMWNSTTATLEGSWENGAEHLFAYSRRVVFIFKLKIHYYLNNIHLSNVEGEQPWEQGSLCKWTFQWKLHSCGLEFALNNGLFTSLRLREIPPRASAFCYGEEIAYNVKILYTVEYFNMLSANFTNTSFKVMRKLPLQNSVF